MADLDLQISFRPRSEVLIEIRDELREWLERCAVRPDIIEELVLSADELCSNAIDAASGGVVKIHARCDGSAVHLEVSNAGNAPEEISRPGTADRDGGAVLADRGRGLSIVRAFTDSLAIVNVDGRTVARAVRLLPA